MNQFWKFLSSQPKRARMDTQNQQLPTNNNGKASASLSQESEQQIVQALPVKSAATLIIVFISIILYIILYKVELLEYSRLKIESILNILNEIFQMPIDDPIFRNLANSTTILIEDLVKFNIPASDNVKDLRMISIFLSDVISSSSDPTNLSPSSYLKNLGDKTYDVGNHIESIYVSGSLTLDELFNEFQDIKQNLSISSKVNPLLLIQKEETQDFYDKVYNQILNLISRSKDPLLTQNNAQYFHSRLYQILNLITSFHDKFVKIEKEIKDIQKLYRGYNNAQGFSNIINYINENESTYKQIYDMKTVQQKLDFERRQMDQLMAIDHEVIRIKESLNLYKNNLNDFIERIINLINRKIITHEDSQMLSEVLNRVDKAKEIWKEMDDSENNRLFRIEN